MAYTKVNYEDVEAQSPGMHFLREPLAAENLGLTVLECEAGWSGKEHDHADEEHEEIYLLVEGAATVHVEGDAVDLEPGDAIRIPPEAPRSIEVGDVPSTLVLAGAP
jgi:quercetin dioxygenase-like cupin family protein